VERLYIYVEKKQNWRYSIHFRILSWFKETWANFLILFRQFHLAIINNTTFFSEKRQLLRSLPWHIRGHSEPSPRKIIHGDLSLSPRASLNTSIRDGETGENHEKYECERVRASEFAVCANEREDSFSLSFWFQLARDLANVLVTGEVVSVSVDLHLIQRAEQLFGDHPFRSLVSPGESSCQVAFLFFFFYFFLLFFSRWNGHNSLDTRENGSVWVAINNIEYVETLLWYRF